MLSQRTVAATVHAIGIGVHTGKPTRMTLRPAPANTGIKFLRSDKAGRSVAAKAECVYDTTLATSLAFDDVQVATVEHLMSALWGLQIDNLLVDLNNEEVPIMDGSSRPFIDLIKTVGTAPCRAPRKFLRITDELTVTHADSRASLLPFDGFKASYTFVSEQEVYKKYPAHVEIDFSKIDYAEDISKARSFGLVDELSQAHAINRCLGSDLDNAVGLDENGVMNEDGLRYNDEFVRHKILDAIGDLYLLGMPIIGEFVGYKSGHTLNNRLIRAVIRCPENWELVNAFDVPELVDWKQYAVQV